jgi:hypothetical protein
MTDNQQLTTDNQQPTTDNKTQRLCGYKQKIPKESSSGIGFDL